MFGVHDAAAHLPNIPEPFVDIHPQDGITTLFGLSKLENAHRLALMTTGTVVEGDDPGPLVCSCFAVGRNTILRAIEAHGFTATRQVVSCLRAGGNCGSCLPEIKGLLGYKPQRIPVSISTALPLLT